MPAPSYGVIRRSAACACGYGYASRPPPYAPITAGLSGQRCHDIVNDGCCVVCAASPGKYQWKQRPSDGYPNCRNYGQHAYLRTQTGWAPGRELSPPRRGYRHQHPVDVPPVPPHHGQLRHRLPENDRVPLIPITVRSPHPGQSCHFTRSFNRANVARVISHRM